MCHPPTRPLGRAAAARPAMRERATELALQGRCGGRSAPPFRSTSGLQRGRAVCHTCLQRRQDSRVAAPAERQGGGEGIERQVEPPQGRQHAWWQLGQRASQRRAGQRQPATGAACGNKRSAHAEPTLAPAKCITEEQLVEAQEAQVNPTVPAQATCCTLVPPVGYTHRAQLPGRPVPEQQ